jgi:hypothetical protein
VKYLNEHIDTEDIKAEILISQMDTQENLSVRMQGLFSRNYSEDLMSVVHEKDRTLLYLSRNGIFHLLPEGLFFEETRLKSVRGEYFEGKYDKFKKEKEKIKSFFQPFDTEYFKQSFELEKKLNAITECGNTVFIKTFLNEPDIDTNNEYLSKIKILLPFVSYLRGNFTLLTNILKETLSVEKVEIREIQPLYMRFIIHKESLNKEEYKKIDEKLTVFFDFFCRWFLPAEAEYDYKIKDYKTPFTLGNTLILDYNTHL